MAVTADKYELPMAVTDSAAEMGRICGMERTTSVYKAIRKRCKTKRLQAFIVIVEVEDEID